MLRSILHSNLITWYLKKMPYMIEFLSHMLHVHNAHKTSIIMCDVNIVPLSRNVIVNAGKLIYCFF